MYIITWHVERLQRLTDRFSNKAATLTKLSQERASSGHSGLQLSEMTKVGVTRILKELPDELEDSIMDRQVYSDPILNVDLAFNI